MNMLTMKGNWNIAIGWLEQKLGRLTHNNMQFTKGMKDELTGRIQKRAAKNNKKFDATNEHTETKLHNPFKS